MSDSFEVRDERSANHFWAYNQILDEYGPKIGAYGFAVYMALCRFSWKNTGKCEITCRQLATLLDVSPATINRALYLLINNNLIREDFKSSHPSQGPSRYSILKVSVSIANAAVSIGNASVSVVKPSVSIANGSVSIGNTNKERIKDIPKDIVKGAREEGADSESRILEICQAHPAYEKPLDTQRAICEQVDRLINLNSWSAAQVFAYLLERTRLYAEAFHKAPQSRQAFVVGSSRWFRGACFEESEATWKNRFSEPEHKNGNGYLNLEELYGTKK